MLIFTDLPNIRVLIIKQIAPRESRDFIDFPLTFCQDILIPSALPTGICLNCAYLI